MICPNCRHKVTLDNIKSSEYLLCPSCGVRLTIKEKRSHSIVKSIFLGSIMPIFLGIYFIIKNYTDIPPYSMWMAFINSSLLVFGLLGLYFVAQTRGTVVLYEEKSIVSNTNSHDPIMKDIRQSLDTELERHVTRKKWLNRIVRTLIIIMAFAWMTLDYLEKKQAREKELERIEERYQKQIEKYEESIQIKN